MYYRYRGEDWYRLERSVSEERMEQGAGVRRRASLREDDAGNGEGQPREGQASGDGKASGEILEASGAQKAGAPWAGTRRTGAGLWPQPLSGTAFGKDAYLGAGQAMDLCRNQIINSQAACSGLYYRGGEHD